MRGNYERDSLEGKGGLAGGEETNDIGGRKGVRMPRDTEVEGRETKIWWK